jgi:hypothetical protein
MMPQKTNILDVLKIIYFMDMEYLIFQKRNVDIMVNLKKIYLMVKVFILIMMDHFFLVYLKMVINIMVLFLNQMVFLFIKKNKFIR